MNNQDSQPKKNLKDSVLTRLQKNHIEPTSKFWWQCRECVIWVLWLCSMALGVVSVAVLLFTSTHAGYAFYEATHDSFLTLLVDLLPKVWVILVGVTVLLTYVELRQTKRGYKYTPTYILLSSMAISLLGGGVLHLMGAGHIVDSKLGLMLDEYDSQEERELALWQVPEEGRLVGKATAAASTTVFTDVKGKEWVVETDDLHEADMKILTSGKDIRLIGFEVGPSTIHACGAFPWMMDEVVLMHDMENERRAFISRMYAHKDAVTALERSEKIAEEVFGDKAMGKCSDLPIVDRISDGM